MSNSLDPDRGPNWVQTVCQCYQQTTLVDKELREARKQALDVRGWGKPLPEHLRDGRKRLFVKLGE